MSRQTGSVPDRLWPEPAAPVCDAIRSPDRARRRLPVTATTAIGVIGAAFAAAPFLQSLRLKRKAQASDGPIAVELDQLEPGNMGKARKLELELRLIADVDPADLYLSGFQKDSFLTLRVARYL